MNEAGIKFRISIRTRILGMVLLLIAAVFLVILTVFNLLVQEYIKSSVNAQLEEAVKAMDVSYPRYISPGVQSPPVPETEFVPDLRRLPRGPLGKAEAEAGAKNLPRTEMRQGRLVDESTLTFSLLSGAAMVAGIAALLFFKRRRYVKL